MKPRTAAIDSLWRANVATKFDQCSSDRHPISGPLGTKFDDSEYFILVTVLLILRIVALY